MLTSRDVKNEIVAFLGEFIGTFLFLFFAFAGAQTVNHAAASKATPETANIPNLDNLMFISIVFGISLMVNVWIFFRISGGMFNPAVTMALYLVGAFPILRGIVVFGAQIVGGITAATVVKFLIPGGREVDFTVSLGDNTSVVRGLFLEMFFTAELVFTILMLAAEKSKDTFVAPIGIGFALFIGHICGIFFTGAGLNPTRSFGAAVIAGKFPSYHWIYWLGPILGSLLAVFFFKIFKLLRYEDTNGDADKAAYEPESFQKFIGRNSRRASAIMDGTTKKASVLFDKTTATAASLYERRRGGSRRQSRSVLTGDSIPLRRWQGPADTDRNYSQSPPEDLRFRSDYTQPKQTYTYTRNHAPYVPRDPRTPFSATSSQRTYVGNYPDFDKRYPIPHIPSNNYYPDLPRKYPITTIHSNQDSASSSILNMPPIESNSFRLPDKPYNINYEIPIGIAPRVNRYMQEDRERFRLPRGVLSPPRTANGSNGDGLVVTML